MAGQALLECGFLIPIRRDKNLSDGKPHPTKAWDWLEKELYYFGGATRASEHYKGWYVDPHTRKVVKDLSCKYLVAVQEAELDKLRALLRSACKVFQQKCIYLSIAGRVEFIEGDSP